MKNNTITKFEKAQAEKIAAARESEFPKFSVGDTVSVKYKITEGTTTRLQAFQGVVLAKAKDDSNYNATFTVRKMSSGIGVERNFALYSPLVASIEVLKRGSVRRAKLYYLRNLTGKAARIKEKMDVFAGKKAKVEEVKKEEKAAAAPKKEEVKPEEK